MIDYWIADWHITDNAVESRDGSVRITAQGIVATGATITPIGRDNMHYVDRQAMQGGLSVVLSPEQAQLLDAAPDLLAACKAALDYMQEYGRKNNEYWFTFGQLQNAIAKAEGGE